MEDKQILNVVEAAAFLGLSAFTVREYAKRGTIPARKVGKMWRFYRDDLAAMVRMKEDPAPEQEQG